ncbi:hypothetical protein [Aliiglaciecola sp. LCG003]|uniref:hypothetical protein n=1 Tax=Aliiglaciecola sp. LCG003 TaxID=3053655 RepID=UPI0025748080|nr:hypothetical protein [Aliiglaciecola sp. LCG003]WJG10802.1 hypothetical protein QR722_07125 [Aliiglaciecola sp. LCG003]
MYRIFFLSLFLLSFSAQASEVSESSVSGKWDVVAVIMGTLGELPAGEGDYFLFENGNFTSSAMGEVSSATYTVEENKIVVTHPTKKEVLTITELTNEKMLFTVDLYVNGKKMTAGNISFKLIKSVNGS